MNLPNKLTIGRIFMIIPFLFFLFTDMAGEWGNIVAAVIFVVACLTDLLDGNIARKKNIVTNFGKLMDPLADKLLVCAALVAFVELNYLPSWIVIIIISREFIINGFRLVASDSGVVISASYWGKFKTTFQMFMIILIMLQLDFKYIDILENIVIYISLALTIISLVDYIWKNKHVMTSGGSK